MNEFMNVGMQECWDVGMQECRNVGMWKNRNMGMQECIVIIKMRIMMRNIDNKRNYGPY